MTKKTSATVHELRPQKAASTLKASEKKWGVEVMKVNGFCMVPSLLFHAQQRLGINPVQLCIILHLADHWWDVDRKPYPSKSLLAERLQMSARQVQRQIAELEKAGLVKRISRTAAHRGKLTNAYDLSGLVNRLKELEPDFREVKEEAKEKKEAVAKRGFKRRAKMTAETK